MLSLRAIPQGPKIGLNPYVSETAVLLDRAYARWSAVSAAAVFPAEPIGPWGVRGECWENVQLLIAERAVSSIDFERGGEPLLPFGRLLAVVIPGTNEFEDWTAGNFSPWPVVIGGLPGRWRRGFALAGEWAWSRLRAEYRPGDLILICGHSYGAAAATVAAAYAIRDGFRGSILGVFAFASPRTTTRAGAKYLSEVYGKITAQRYALGFDVVPHAVPGVVWRHALEGIFIGSDGVCRPRFGFARELGAAMKARGLQSVADHAMRKYLRWALGAAPRPFGASYLDFDK